MAEGTPIHPPVPGEPGPAPLRMDWRVVALLVGIGIVAVAALGPLRGLLGLPKLPVRAVADREFLRLSNTSSNDLPPLTININSLDAHRFTLPGLKAGSTVTLAWERFADGDRTLDPRVTRPELVMLRAKGYELTLLNVSRLTP